MQNIILQTYPPLHNKNIKKTFFLTTCLSLLALFASPSSTFYKVSDAAELPKVRILNAETVEQAAREKELQLKKIEELEQKRQEIEKQLAERQKQMQLEQELREQEEKQQKQQQQQGKLIKEWLVLQQRLIDDGLDRAMVMHYFNTLPSKISQDPMGRKIQELYTSAFVKKKPAAPSTSKTPPQPSPVLKGYKTPGPWYRNIVTEEVTQKTIAFLQKHKTAFDSAEKKYGVPREVLVSLLFIETRLGEYLGAENAFYTLASMASSKSYEQIPTWIAKLPDNPASRKDWINTRMEQRSEWAYKELKALLVHTIKNKLDPYNLPGSVYGAIGIAQFMPSNLSAYAVDGNDDGIVDLFTPADAIASAANYLKKHKWVNTTIPEKVKVLKRYNNLTIYANTILALAERIEKTTGKQS